MDDRAPAPAPSFVVGDISVAAACLHTSVPVGERDLMFRQRQARGYRHLANGQLVSVATLPPAGSPFEMRPLERPPSPALRRLSPAGRKNHPSQPGVQRFRAQRARARLREYGQHSPTAPPHRLRTRGGVERTGTRKEKRRRRVCRSYPVSVWSHPGTASTGNCQIPTIVPPVKGKHKQRLTADMIRCKLDRATIGLHHARTPPPA